MRVSIITAIILGATVCAHGQDTETFERVFGVPRMIPSETVEAVLALEPGERIERDRNLDGKVDELWYIDTSKRHNIQPMLVRVLDEDGDMAETGRGDLDSDCYFWDHHADGRIDIVTDYVDDDGDDDVDQMGIFYDKLWPDEKDDLTVWWSVDIGDDNMLWYDVNGNYYQPLCQWRTHFGGDELFYQFRLSEEDEKWVNVWEDPFAFYDLDDDGSSEMVIRISAVGDAVKNLRYSIDADDDAYGDRTRNYDFSITGLPPESGMSSAEWAGDSIVIRGIETLPLLSWEKTQPYALQAPWAKAMFIWDEVNSNTDIDPGRDPNERWEGILNAASKYGDFEQVGGPPCSVYNKRVEVSHAPASPLQLYFDMADQRFHLLGSKYGYLDIDYNFDGEVDAAYTWEDADGDGRVDLRKWDMNADGDFEIEQPLDTTGDTISPTFEATYEVYPEVLDRVLEGSQRFIDTAEAAIGFSQDEQAVIDYFNGALSDYHPERELGAHIRKTPAGQRMYVDLVRDRMFLRVQAEFGSDSNWDEIQSAYFSGDYAEAAMALRRAAGTPHKADSNDRPLVHNGETYEFWKLATLRPEHPQANPIEHSRYATYLPDDGEWDYLVAEGDYRLGWRIVPHQVDTFNFAGDEQIAFLMDLNREEQNAYRIFRRPKSGTPVEFTKMTNAVLDNPAYVAWESDAGAFRFYTGQFDFFGKQQDRLLPREERLIYPLIDVNYHAEQDWGIDALHVGTTSGLGGLTIYSGGKEYPVQSPAGEGHVEFTYRVLGSGPVRAAVAITAHNVFPEMPDKVVDMICYIYAGHEHSEVHVRLPDGLEDPQVGIGLMRLPNGYSFGGQRDGYLAEWGWHGDDIGEIGIAAIADRSDVVRVEELEHERRIICDPQEQIEDRRYYHLNYFILGGWRRGMQYPIGPTGENWEQKVSELANEINLWRLVD